MWVARCGAQIAGTLAVLEQDRGRHAGDCWRGPGIGHEDIAFACAWRFINEAHPGLLDPAAYPSLAGAAARLEALPAFRAIAQTFLPPA